MEKLALFTAYFPNILGEKKPFVKSLLFLISLKVTVVGKMISFKFFFGLILQSTMDSPLLKKGISQI